VRGRDFERLDAPGRPLVAVVNQAFVARHLPAGDPVGGSVNVFGARRLVVGVVGNERFLGLEAGPAAAVYVPLAQNPMPSIAILAGHLRGLTQRGPRAAAARGSTGRRGGERIRTSEAWRPG
jgi:hypothetical protein